MADLVEVAFVGDEVEAAMIQALLEQYEIPSLLQQVIPSGRQVGSVVLPLADHRRARSAGTRECQVP